MKFRPYYPDVIDACQLYIVADNYLQTMSDPLAPSLALDSDARTWNKFSKICSKLGLSSYLVHNQLKDIEEI